jgi:hypothetical protein
MTGILEAMKRAVEDRARSSLGLPVRGSADICRQLRLIAQSAEYSTTRG